MLSMNLGPFAISSTMVSLLAAGLAASGIGHLGELSAASLASKLALLRKNTN